MINEHFLQEGHAFCPKSPWIYISQLLVEWPAAQKFDKDRAKPS